MTLVELFPYIKGLHITTVVITGGLFLLRFIWMINGTLQRRGNWVRRLPATNDTILLACGLAMTTIIHQYPFIHGWLTAKVVALLAYIIFGVIALRLGKGQKIRIIAGIFALLCYGYIISAALKHDPFPLTLIFS
ncbi:MAG: SirB2 family protein [Candidatus Polarisedimenticolaceae bacterium]|nr:SirB2 family protein [Candidatus Polarisedimenticolaceae bacterium]